MAVQSSLPQPFSKPQMLMLMLMRRRVSEGRDRVWWLGINHCNITNIFGRL